MVYNTNPYQNYPYQFQQSFQVPQPSNTSSAITWVQGEAGAKAYPVAAGSSMLLMDSETENFYIKSTDSSGMPQPLRKFKYKEILDNQPTELPTVAQAVDSSQFVTREEFERRISELNRKASRNIEYKKHGGKEDV